MKYRLLYPLFLTTCLSLFLIQLPRDSVTSAAPQTAHTTIFSDLDVTSTQVMTASAIYLPFIGRAIPIQNVPAEVAACQLSGPPSVGMGFAQHPDRASTLGTMRVKVLFVDFPDAPAIGTTEEHFMHLTQTVGFYNQLSYGRMDLQLEPVHKWYRMNELAAAWDADFRTPPYSDGARRTIELADPEVDFSGVDVVYILTSNTFPYWLNAAHYPPPTTSWPMATTSAISPRAVPI